MGIIGALYERGCCGSQQEIPHGRRPWNPTLQKRRVGHPAAEKGLIPTERFAQQEEKIINGELQADKKKQ
jgi:hypothetical protein